jgi:hypothetical protein
MSYCEASGITPRGLHILYLWCKGSIKLKLHAFYNSAMLYGEKFALRCGHCTDIDFPATFLGGIVVI